jgi:hypothetical protein
MQFRQFVVSSSSKYSLWMTDLMEQGECLAYETSSWDEKSRIVFVNYLIDVLVDLFD